jgi:hypothetical protein
MGKVKRLELWWQLHPYVTSGLGLRKNPPLIYCATECTKIQENTETRTLFCRMLNAVRFGHFQRECYSFGEVLLFIRRFRISSEKRLFPSTDLSVHIYRRGSHCTDFCEIWYWNFHENLSRKIQIWLKSDNNIRHYTWRLKYVYIVDNSTIIL